MLLCLHVLSTNREEDYVLFFFFSIFLEMFDKENTDWD